MTALSRNSWLMHSIGKSVCNMMLTVALTWCVVGGAAAQTSDSHLHGEILAELRAAHAEAPSIGSQSPQGAAISAMEAYETVFPLCSSERASDYYAAFGRLHGLDGPTDLEQLGQEVFEARNRVGFWQEARWPASDAVGYDIVSRAALDWAIGEWLGRNYLFREGAIESSESAAVALVFRTWCRVRMQNQGLLSQFIANHGFPSEARFSSQIESTALYIVKHSDASSPLVSRYERAARTAHARHELSDANYALLLDTMAVFRGQSQPIGSYYNCEGANAVFDPPLENRRRAESYDTATGFVGLRKILRRRAVRDVQMMLSHKTRKRSCSSSSARLGSPDALVVLTAVAEGERSPVIGFRRREMPPLGRDGRQRVFQLDVRVQNGARSELVFIIPAGTYTLATGGWATVWNAAVTISAWALRRLPRGQVKFFISAMSP